MAKQKQQIKKVGKAVVKKETTTVGTVVDYGSDAGAGFEGMRREDFAIPFFGILQKGSPQVDEDDGAYIDGAEQGMFLNTVTKDIYEGREAGVRFIPCHAQRSFVEWIPRDDGGGFVAQHHVDDPIVKSAKVAVGARKDEQTKFSSKIAMANGHELVETAYVYGLLLDDADNFQQVVVAFTSTQLKKYREWMTKARSISIKLEDKRAITPPLYAHVYRLTIVPEQNDQGKWFGWRIGFDGANAAECRLTPEDELYQQAKVFRDLANSGQARAAVETVLQDKDDDGEM